MILLVALVLSAFAPAATAFAPVTVHDAELPSTLQLARQFIAHAVDAQQDRVQAQELAGTGSAPASTDFVLSSANEIIVPHGSTYVDVVFDFAGPEGERKTFTQLAIQTNSTNPAVPLKPQGPSPSANTIIAQTGWNAPNYQTRFPVSASTNLTALHPSVHPPSYVTLLQWAHGVFGAPMTGSFTARLEIPEGAPSGTVGTVTAHAGLSANSMMGNIWMTMLPSTTTIVIASPPAAAYRTVRLNAGTNGAWETIPAGWTAGATSAYITREVPDGTAWSTIAAFPEPDAISVFTFDDWGMAQPTEGNITENFTTTGQWLAQGTTYHTIRLNAGTDGTWATVIAGWTRATDNSYITREVLEGTAWSTIAPFPRPRGVGAVVLGTWNPAQPTSGIITADFEATAQWRVPDPASPFVLASAAEIIVPPGSTYVDVVFDFTGPAGERKQFTQLAIQTISEDPTVPLHTQGPSPEANTVIAQTGWNAPNSQTRAVSNSLTLLQWDHGSAGAPMAGSITARLEIPGDAPLGTIGTVTALARPAGLGASNYMLTDGTSIPMTVIPSTTTIVIGSAQTSTNHTVRLNAGTNGIWETVPAGWNLSIGGAYIYRDDITNNTSWSTIATIPEPTQAGYEFVRWEINGEPAQFPLTVTGPITLTAQWEALTAPLYHDVTWVLGTGTWSAGFTPQTTVAHGGTVAVIAPANTPIRTDGYTFDGWTVGGVAVELPLANVTNNIILTARWAPPIGGGGGFPGGGLPDDGGDDDNGGVPVSRDHHAFLVGFPDGTIRPEATLTRAEAATIFFRLICNEFRASPAVWRTNNQFADVQTNNWFNNAVSTIASLDVVRGRTNTTFAPNSDVTNAEFYTMLVRFIGLAEDEITSLRDPDDHWAARDTRVLEALSLIPEGTSEDRQLLNTPITRASVAELVNRAVTGRVVESRAHLIVGLPRLVWSDLFASSPFYLDMMMASHTVEYVIVDSDTNGSWNSVRWTRILPHLNWTVLERPGATGQEIFYALANQQEQIELHAAIETFYQQVSTLESILNI